MERRLLFALILAALFLFSGCVLFGSNEPDKTLPTLVSTTPTNPIETPVSNASYQNQSFVSSDEVKADMSLLLSRVNYSDLSVIYQTAYNSEQSLPSSIWSVYRKENLSRIDRSLADSTTRVYVLGSDTTLCTTDDSGWVCTNSSKEAAKAKTIDLDLISKLSSLNGNFTMSKDQTFLETRCTCYRISGGDDFQLHDLTISPSTVDLCVSPQGTVLYSHLSAQAEGSDFEYTLTPLNYSHTISDSQFVLPALILPPVKPHLEMVFYSLGMGDATLLKADNITMLIDTGNESTAESLATSLLQRDVSRIDILLISSWNVNNLGGLDSIFKRFTVSEIWVPGDPPDNRAFVYPWAVMHQAASPIRSVSDGDSFNYSSVSFEIFNPPKKPYSQSPEANSVVMRIKYHSFCAFMPGNIASEQHASLVGKLGNLPCDVYKWPYHGRGRSEAPLLFDKLWPSDVVISVGPNSENLPSYTTLTRLNISSTRVWRTDLNGDISVNVEPSGNFVITSDT